MKQWFKRINPVAKAMLQNRQSPKVIPNKKKDYYPDIDDHDGVWIDTLTGEVRYEDDDYYKLGKDKDNES